MTYRRVCTMFSKPANSSPDKQKRVVFLLMLFSSERDFTGLRQQIEMAVICSRSHSVSTAANDQL